jgi:hypothetical protein
MVIGTIKAGTTSLYHYLKQHPNVYMSPKKEPGFFAVDYDRPLDEGFNRFAITAPEDYQAQFTGVADEAAVGEASPQYLWSPLAPARIKEALPNVKLIAGLRNPVDRAFSAYAHLRREGVEPFEDFDRALQEEPARIAQHLGPLWRYQEVGLYAAQLERYFTIFDRSQIMIYLFEDLRNDARALLQAAFRFIGVDDSFAPDVRNRHNVSGVPRSRRLYGWLRGRSRPISVLASVIPAPERQRLALKVQKWNLVKPTMSAKTRAALVEVYREDILKTQDLIHRDLSGWLQ